MLVIPVARRQRQDLWSSLALQARSIAECQASETADTMSQHEQGRHVCAYTHTQRDKQTDGQRDYWDESMTTDMTGGCVNARGYECAIGTFWEGSEVQFPQNLGEAGPVSLPCKSHTYTTIHDISKITVGKEQQNNCMLGDQQAVRSGSTDRVRASGKLRTGAPAEPGLRPTEPGITGRKDSCREDNIPQKGNQVPILKTWMDTVRALQIAAFRETIIRF